MKNIGYWKKNAGRSKARNLQSLVHAQMVTQADMLLRPSSKDNPMRYKHIFCLSWAALTCTQVSAGDSLPQFTNALFSTQKCPDGWAPRISQDGVLMVPTTDVSAVGAQAGAPLRMRTDLEDPIHQHGVAVKFHMPSISFAIVAGCCNNSVASQGDYSADGTSAMASSELPMRSMLICEKLTAPDPTAVPVPGGSLALIDSLACPAGWTLADDAISNRYLVGLPDGGTPNATFGGQPLEPGELPLHDHPFTTEFYAPSPGVAAVSGCCTSGWAPSQTYTDNGTSAQTRAAYPYRMLLACTKS